MHHATATGNAWLQKKTPLVKGLKRVLDDSRPLKVIHVSNVWFVGVLDAIEAATCLLEKYCTLAVAK